MSIHKTAVIHDNAVIGEDVSIGAFSVIGPGVRVGEGTKIAPHVLIEHALIGKRCCIRAGSIIGGMPQLLHFDEKTVSTVAMGDDNIIGEYVSIHRSGKEGGSTVVGDGNYIMTLAHLGHDCIIGNRTIITSYAGLSGHVRVEDRAVIGGHAGIHQFVTIGRLAMVGGMARLVKNVPPYFLIEGNPAVARGLNSVGLKRSGMKSGALSALKKAYRILCRSGLNVSQAVGKIKSDIPETEETVNLLQFIEQSERGVTL